MTSILSDTFAPPRIATNGRSGDFERVAEIAQLLLHQQAGGRARQVMRDPLDRRVRPVRRAERVVHVEIGERGERRRERGSFFSSSGWKRRFSSSTTPAGRVRLLDRALRGLADAVVGEDHGRAEQFRQPRRDRPQAELRRRLAFGPSEVAREHDGRALFERVCDRRQRRADARVVADRRRSSAAR